MKHAATVLLMLLVALAAQAEDSAKTLKIMQLNTWRSGLQLPGAREGIAAQIKKEKPHIVIMCECAVDGKVSEKVAELLAKDGLTYYYPKQHNDCQVISTFPIIEEKPMSNQLKVTLDGGDLGRITVYSLHLNYRSYACYLPRGYDGNTWEKLPNGPVTSVEPVIAMNLASRRHENIAQIIKDAQPHLEAGEIVVLGGDFNEPSHLDWTEATANLYGHNGIVMPWHTTRTLEDAGWIDVYRQKYPDPVTYPGFTFPCNNENIAEKKLAWAPDADERDRIDFIFIPRTPKLAVRDAFLIGPETMIVYGKRDSAKTKDRISTPASVWPSDHRGNCAILDVFDSRP